MRKTLQRKLRRLGIWSQTRCPCAKLKAECLSRPEDSVLVTCYRNDQLIGQAFATNWAYEDRTVCWLSLTVHRYYRRRYIATSLLQTLKYTNLFTQVSVVGLTSTHPAACSAISRLARVCLPNVNLEFIRDHAAGIIACSPVP